MKDDEWIKVKTVLEDDNRIKKLLKKKNVVAVKPGVKNDSDEPCIKILVEEKKDESELDSADIVPKTVSTAKTGKSSGGRVRVKTDVEGGMKMPEAQADRTAYSPLKPGEEIGPKGHPYVGTHGGTLRIRKYKTKAGKWIDLFGRWIGIINLLDHWGIKITKSVDVECTNKHVTTKGATDSSSIGTKISQPGVTGRVIGEVTHEEPLDENSVNELDWAEFQLYDGVKRDYDILEVGLVDDVVSPRVGEDVQKYGRTTRHTEGRILDGPMHINVSYGDMVLSFKDVWMVGTNFSAGGDSGSWIVTKDGDLVLILFAGNGTYTFGFPAEKVIQKRKLSFPQLSWTSQLARVFKK